MSVHKFDELLLQGRLQVDVARNALSYTGINPATEAHLQACLDVHETVSEDNDRNVQSSLVISLQGGTTENDKKDILSSLDAISQNEKIALDLRLASAALRDILQQ